MPRLTGPRAVGADVRTTVNGARQRQKRELASLRSATAAHKSAMKRLDAMRGVEAQENPTAPKIPGADEEEES
jgi:hypothetical protein